MVDQTSEDRDGMRVDWDVPIEMDDGVVLRADVYRPPDDGRHPVILTYGPYGKNMPFQVLYADQWAAMIREHPEIAEGSSCAYQQWEVVDPERWVPDGYVCVRVDSRGAGRSPGVLDIFSPRETRDYYECIEWAGVQPWSNGKVGLNGISYYAINQWQVAGLQPPHLTAMCAWEGAADAYRDWHRHGGILSTFTGQWFPSQVVPVQQGYGLRGERDPNSGLLTAGPETRSEEELVANRTNPQLEARLRPLDGEWYRERSADWAKVQVPFLSAGSWGGAGLHLRGNVEAFTEAASPQKWLEIHGLEHWTHFYTDYGVDLQKRFFGYFLKEEDTGWDREAPVLLNIRHPGERFELRGEQEWPLARTSWTRYFLDAGRGTLAPSAPEGETNARYDAGRGEGVTFRTAPLDEPTEITGPLAAKLYVSTTARDVDLFVIVQVFDPQGVEITFAGSVEPAAPIAQGWLRASHRKLDSDRTREYRPYHTHDEVLPVTPGEIYELDVEVWPTCLVMPTDHTLALTVQAGDLARDTVSGALGTLGTFRGSGPYQHVDPWDRRPERTRGEVTIHCGGSTASYLLLPVIP